MLAFGWWVSRQNIMMPGMKTGFFISDGYHFFSSPLFPGPNDITFEFSAWAHMLYRRLCCALLTKTDLFDRIWRSFIPFHSYQVFQRGGYYSIEVIPDSVAVISLNTMYFYASNKGSYMPNMLFSSLRCCHTNVNVSRGRVWAQRAPGPR